jgi:hypothetical protein
VDVHEKGTPQVRIVIIYIWGHECIFFPQSQDKFLPNFYFFSAISYIVFHIAAVFAVVV